MVLPGLNSVISVSLSTHPIDIFDCELKWNVANMTTLVVRLGEMWAKSGFIPVSHLPGSALDTGSANDPASGLPIYAAMR